MVAPKAAVTVPANVPSAVALRGKHLLMPVDSKGVLNVFAANRPECVNNVWAEEPWAARFVKAKKKSNVKRAEPMANSNAIAVAIKASGKKNATNVTKTDKKSPDKHVHAATANAAGDPVSGLTNRADILGN